MMTDRRETPRKQARIRPGRGHKQKGQKPKGQKPRKSHPEPDWSDGERIAKYLARAGVASRRDVERLIEEGLVMVNGQRLRSPAFKVHGGEHIEVRGQPIAPPEGVRVWRYHKPAGLITTNQDPEGRATIFEQLPSGLPRIITIGRLDLTTEGLLLLTNDGGLARALELPRTGLRRTYRVRAHGEVKQEKLEALGEGLKLPDGTRYSRIEAHLERQTGANNWLTATLFEGQNREVRKAMEHIGLQVNRLIRTDYGPFELGDLKPGAVDEIPPQKLISGLGDKVDQKFLPVARTSVRRPNAGNQRTSARSKRPKTS